MGHDGDKPLEATYTTQRPPWVGLWSDREYKGRPDWWKEPGLKDSVVRDGKLRLMRTHYKEEDPDWFDPKVPDGTSLSGPLGLDSKKHKDITKKGDQPGDLEHFQDKVYHGSHQFKDIAARFGLSKEHPGLATNPSLNDLINVPKNHLGRNAILPNSWYSFGPRFFDKPLNEDSFGKGLACAKYAAILLAPYTLLEIRAINSVKVGEFGPMPYLKRYVKLAPLPLAAAFSWGVTLSAAANLRHKDDVYNHFYASAAVGAVVASFKDNVPLGLTAMFFSTVAGMFWQYQRVSETGLQGMVPQPQSAGIWSGPLAWKMFQNGDSVVPKEKY